MRGAMIAVAILGTAAPAAASQADSGTAHRNVVWRVDAGVQRMTQASRGGENAPAGRITKMMNGWGGTGVIVFAALLWLGGRLAGTPTVARVGLRGSEALAIASGISGIIKGLAGRARPFLVPGEPWHWDFNHGWSDARYFSMPSGHTTATMAFAVGVCIAAWRAWRWPGLAFGLLAIGSAVGVGASRVYSNQHWLSDVVVGSLLGATVAIALARGFRNRPATRYHRVMLGRAAAPDGEPAVVRAAPRAATTLALVAVLIPAWAADAQGSRPVGSGERLEAGGRPARPEREAVLVRADVRILAASLAGSIALIGADERIVRWTQASTLQASGPFRSTLDAASHMGGPAAILIGVGLWTTGTLAGSRTTALVGRRASEAIVLSGAVTSALKGISGRSRPDHPPARATNFALARGIRDGDGYDSFPSGHATVAFALASAIDAEWSRLSPSRPRWIAPALYVAATLTAASRVFDERHWASDVVLGSAIGFVGGRVIVRWRSDSP